MAFKILSSFYIAAIRHLGFLEIQILTSHTVLRVNMRRHIKFGGDRLNRCWDIAVFSIFQDGGGSPSWIFNVENFHFRYSLDGQ